MSGKRRDWLEGDLCCIEVGPYSFVGRIIARGPWRARVSFYVPGEGVKTRRVPWSCLLPYDGRNDD